MESPNNSFEMSTSPLVEITTGKCKQVIGRISVLLQDSPIYSKIIIELEM